MNWSKIVTVFGQLTFFTLLIAQCLLLASYPAKYQNNSSWYAFLLFIAPAFGISWWRIASHERSDAQLVCVWLAYVWLGLVPMIGIVFELTAEKLNKNKQFGPDELKIALCITPLLLLLLNTGTDTITRGEIAVLSYKMIIDIFDGNELLQIVIDENIENVGIPQSFMRALISFACITFLLSPLEMAANLLVGEQAGRQETLGMNGFIHVCLNLILFGLRLGIWLGEGWNYSFFIVKNVIMIYVRGLEFYYPFRDEDGEPENNNRDPSAPPPSPPQWPPELNPAYHFRDEDGDEDGEPENNYRDPSAPPQWPLELNPAFLGQFPNATNAYEINSCTTGTETFP